MTPRRVIGTDVFHAAILLWAAGIAHVVGGNVDFGLVGTILLGSIPGVWIGSHLTARLPTGLLRVALAVVLICSSLALFNKAGVDVPLAVVIALPATIGVALGARQLVRRERAVRPASSGASGTG
jgi:uncharacterized membrane protein YfcA